MVKKSQKSLRIALAHDYLREYGGAERVLEALHELFPQAPVYVAFKDEAAMGLHWQRFQDWDVRETWLAKIPLIKQIYSPLRVLAPKAFADLDLSKYDLVISSSNAYFAKAVQVSNGEHICYCHTPPRALYGYTTMSNWRKNPVTRILGTLINHYTRVVDFKVSQQVDHFIANSQETADRIKKFYRRDSTVIFPPVAVPSKLPAKTKPAAQAKPAGQTKQSAQVGQPSRTKPPIQTQPPARGYYLYVNRLALAKHPESAIQACNQLKLPLKVVGTGGMLKELKAMAGPTIEFLGSIPDDELNQLYAGAKALIYPVEDEDFGMVPVEAMGWGTPVIVHRSGGPMETIVEGQTGVFFEELKTKDLVAAIKKAAKIKFKAEKIHHKALEFNKTKFQKRIKKLINQFS